jgi:hypothetical protein
MVSLPSLAVSQVARVSSPSPSCGGQQVVVFAAADGHGTVQPLVVTAGSGPGPRNAPSRFSRTTARTPHCWCGSGRRCLRAAALAGLGEGIGVVPVHRSKRDRVRAGRCSASLARRRAGHVSMRPLVLPDRADPAGACIEVHIEVLLHVLALTVQPGPGQRVGAPDRTRVEGTLDGPSRRSTWSWVMPGLDEAEEAFVEHTDDALSACRRAPTNAMKVWVPPGPVAKASCWLPSAFFQVIAGWPIRRHDLGSVSIRRA